MRTCKFSELKPGDWFQKDDVRDIRPDGGVRFICVISEGTPDGAHRGWCREVGVIYFKHDSEVTPLPDCTGWDWEPGPKTWYRSECLDVYMPCSWYQRYEDAAPMMADDYIGYTIRRVWPDGRVEQEFVPKEES